MNKAEYNISIPQSFPWYGDEWLYMRDCFSVLTPQEQIVFAFQNQVPLIPENEFMILTRAKRKMANHALYLHVLNAYAAKYPEFREKMLKSKHLISLTQKPQQPKKAQTFFQ